MKLYKKIFYFLLLIPIFVLVYEIRSSLRDTREMQGELYFLNLQRASSQRTIMGLETRILHYVEDHEGDGHKMGGCPLCFKNMLMEKYDHELIKKFLRENGVDVQGFMDGELTEEDLKILTEQNGVGKNGDWSL